MTGKRVRVAVLWLAGLLLLYAAVGFLALPALVKRQMVNHVERNLGHQLGVGEVKFNPLTFAAELTDVELREPTGAPLAGFKRLFVNFEATSLFRRIWTFAAVEVAAPTIALEVRPDGSSNYSTLLAAMRKEPAEPDGPLPKLQIDRISVTDGRIDLADLQAAPDARLRLEPIAFEFTELSTLPAEGSPYTLTARTPDGESVQWGGEIVLNPLSSTGRLALKDWKVATLDRLLGKRVALHSAQGTIELAVDYRLAYANGVPVLSVSNAAAAIDGLTLSSAEGQAPLVAAKRLALAGGSFDLAQRTVTVERIDLVEPAVRFEVDPQGRVNWAALTPHPVGTAAQPPSAPADKTAVPDAPAPSATPTTPAAAPERWTVRLGQVNAQQLSFAMHDARAGSERDFTLAGVDLALKGGIEAGGDTTSAVLEGISIAAAETSMTRAAMSSTMRAPSLAVSRIRWAATPAETQLNVEGAKLTFDNYVLKLGEQSWSLQKPTLSAEAVSLNLPTEAYRIMKVDVQALELQSAALGGRIGDRPELVEAAALVLGARNFSLGITDPIDANVTGLGLSLGQLRLLDPTNRQELARIGKTEARVSTVSSTERRIEIESLTSQDATVAASVDAQGKLSWEAFLAAFAPPSGPAAASEAAKPAASASPWNVTAKSIQLRNAAAGFADQRHNPALAVQLTEVSAALRNLSTNAKSPAALDVAGRINKGGQFKVAGSVNPQTFASDLKLKITELSLLPIQPVLAQHARLKLVSALASADGRLRYGFPKAAGGKLVFEGELQLDKVNLEETEPAQTFLAFESLRASQTKLTLEPGAIDIPDLRINRLVTKIVIGEDQSLNLLQVLRAPPAPAKPAPAASAAPPPEASDAEPPFAVSVARIRFDNSIVDFADLSLRPQFSTRMHELQGVITGVSTSRDTRARIELEARVDEFGSAQIRGSINPFRPRAFTSVDLDFRNIEMTSLTPYTAKFAGYRIASGKLSTTLQYRVKNSALQGDNKIVIDKLELGERVESPTAMNLPLELAIALLKDDSGRIDIGLQVTGSLEDPQFSIAALVWKAIGNLLTRIVTAPFRALGRLFGGGDAETEGLGRVEFDPGTDMLRPPERQKLRNVGEALQKRPQLALTIKPAYAPARDRSALQSTASRTAVLKRAGIKLEPGESPGPLDVGNARIQRAIEEEFIERFGMPTLRDVRAELAKRPAGGAPKADAAGSVEGEKSSAKPSSEEAKPAAGDPSRLATIRLARTLAERLADAVPVSDADLSELGQRRGQAITAELQATKVDPARVTTAAPRAIEDTEGPITSDLDLAVAK